MLVTIRAGDAPTSPRVQTMSSTLRAQRAACLLLVALCCAACQRNDTDASAANVALPPQADAAGGGAPASSRSANVADPAAPDMMPADEATRIVKEMPAADAPTPAVAVGAQITYGCDDGNLVVTYRGPTAELVLPDGSRGTATLSVEESAKAGGEVYVGTRLGLRRIGSVVELQSADGPTRRCVETGGTA